MTDRQTDRQTLRAYFLSQSYRDCWDDYNRSLKLKNFPKWDYVILTASDERQADGYRRQLKAREGYLPASTRFAVISDRDGKRVGSGGATLEVLRYLRQQETSFEGLRVLVIHSGGDSKRVPQYSALGKLFSPVPHRLPDGRSATLFDELMISMSSVPSRMREGMLLLSGDVLLLFNPLQIDYNNEGAAAISFKEHVETGKNHGVYLGGDDGYVCQCLQKKSVEQLRAIGAVNDADCVDIDTGAVIFSRQMMESLYELVEAPQDYDRYVNEKTRLSLYADFLYPLAKNSTLEVFYEEKPEGEPCAELMAAREKVWEVLCPYRMKLLRLAPAEFIHFGTTEEILRLMSGGVDEYAELGWSRVVRSSVIGTTAGYHSVLSSQASVGQDCYLEVSYVHGHSVIGEGSLISYVELSDVTVPENVVLHGLKLQNGSFVVRIFGTQDNPKEHQLFGQDLDACAKHLGVSLWDEGEEHSLWNARIYPQKTTIAEAVAAALKLYELITGTREEYRDAWVASHRLSLCESFQTADSDAILAWNRRMVDLVEMDEIAKAIKNRIPAANLSKKKELTKIQREWLAERLKRADFSEKIRLYYYIGTILEDEEEIQECFQTIQSGLLEAILSDVFYNRRARIVLDTHIVQLPLRVNFGGGWSDTPPYCNENGGTVLNCAILLNEKMPVEVRLERIAEHKIIFDSRDMDVHGEFTKLADLQRTGDPFDPFALQKACLLACGILPRESDETLDQILTRLGGGFIMHSEVTGVPKGSGLGTSSILAAASVKCVCEFMGISCTEEKLYSYVLAMEQIMSTGGGWQDQVGGITLGLKYISSMPGMNQQIKVTHVEVSAETKQELEERFCLIYTGQRRLARNLLRDVVGRYVGNEPDALFALEEIQKLAVLMRFELERGNVDGFAALLDEHWQLSKKIDAGSTNTLIEQIFASIEEFVAGRLVCGAGGGGFLQVILKKGVTRRQVSDRLREVFMDSLVDVAQCRLVWE